MTLTWNQAPVLATLRVKRDRGLRAAAEIVVDEGNRLIRDPPKTGAVYTTRFFTRGRGPSRVVIPVGERAPHQASAPGESPARDTGRLQSSGNVQFDESAQKSYAAWSSKVARFMELGTDRIEPRPFARKSLFSLRVEILSEVTQALQRRL